MLSKIMTVWIFSGIFLAISLKEGQGDNLHICKAIEHINFQMHEAIGKT